MYCLHLWDLWISQASNQQEAGANELVAGYLLGKLFIRMMDALCSFETLMVSCRTPRRHTPGATALQLKLCFRSVKFCFQIIMGVPVTTELPNCIREFTQSAPFISLGEYFSTACYRKPLLLLFTFYFLLLGGGESPHMRSDKTCH
jgi:hypothetical protein